MVLVVGLGNPGAQYAATRHNAGFLTVDRLAQRHKIAIGKAFFSALVGEGRINGEKIVLAKPQTYMNESGISVFALMQWYKLEPQALWICYDDVDLPLGEIRVRGNGSAGTHNGMRSVIARLGTEDFPRVRVGIGAPPPEWDLADYVLSRFDNIPLADKVFDAAASALNIGVVEGVAAAQTAYNGRIIEC